MKKVLYISILLVIQSYSLFAFQIELNIRNYKSQEVSLYAYIEGRLQQLSFKQTDSTGFATFEVLNFNCGMYVLSFDNKENIELLIDKNSDIQLFSTYPNVLSNIECYGNEMLSHFFNYTMEFSDFMNEDESLKRQLLKNFTNRDSVLFYRELITHHKQEMNSYSDSVAAINSNLLGRYIMASQVLQKNIFLSDSTIESSLANLESIKPCFMQLPFLKRFTENLTRALYKTSIKEAIKRMDKVLSWSKGNENLYKHILTHLYNNSAAASNNRNEHFFYHLAKTYYLDDKAPWANEKLLSSMQESVDQLEGTLIGQELILLGKVLGNRERFNYHTSNADLKILVFMKNDCSHCFNELDVLKKATENKLSYTDIIVYDMGNELGSEKIKHFYPDFTVQNVFMYEPRLLEILRISSVPHIIALNKNDIILVKTSRSAEVINTIN
jgi:hypothetical protein